MGRDASFLLASILLVACTSAEEPAKPGGTPEGNGPPATEPAACADGTYRTLDGTCAGFPSLSLERSSVEIAPPRDHHTTAVFETASGPWLYVIGGTDAWQTLHNDVQRARIGPDGKLGAFEQAGILPEPRAGHCMVKKGDRVYVFGGVVGAPTGPRTSSVILTLDADGKVASSAPGPELPIPVLHLACELVGDSVYVLGGRGRDDRATKLSARTRIAADGSASAFEPLTPLIPDRSHHAAFVRGSRLYVLGGITGSTVARDPKSRKDVAVADIAPDGTLSPWFDAGAFPINISVSAAQLYKDAVYVFGGLEDSGFTTKIRRATFNGDGTLSAFETLSTTLPEARGHVHQTPVHGPYIYSVGGKNDVNESLTTVDIGRFDEPFR